MRHRSILCLMYLGACLTVPARDSGASGIKYVRFTFQPVIGGVERIFLAGSFNDWNDSTTPMTDPDGDGVFEAEMLLPPGRYLYKIVVDGRWLTDPEAAETEPDGQGGLNAVRVVDDALPDVVFARGDGRIRTDGIPLRLDYDMVNPLDAERVEFRTRTYRDDVERVILHALRGSDPPETLSMERWGEDSFFTYYRTVLRVGDSSIRFAFVLADGDRVLYAVPGGFREEPPPVDEMFHYSVEILPRFVTPDWAKDGIFYQIFPERFRNGDPSNDPDFSEPWYRGLTELPPSGKTDSEYFHLVTDWDDVAGLTESPYRTDGRPDYYSFYGGDIAGVAEKLDYLEDLGVTILYFNPLNQGKSNHKYDPVDYLKIDPHFGDEAVFKAFVRDARKRGIRIVVDKAFNHTGDWHFAFVDTRERGEASPYWHWYEWYKWPLPPGGCPTPCDYYDCWWGFPLHPNLNFDLSRPNAEENHITDIREAEPNREVVDYLLDVARYWIGELGIDGFRLDVPNEVPFWFWKEFRAVVDSLRPDAFLIGEIWGDAMPWLGPDCFHATMNYKYFRDPVLNFFALGNIDAAAFDGSLAEGRHRYPDEAVHVMMNLIDSHDTERFLTVAGGDIRRLKLAFLFQMTYVGIPQIYYGGEVALEGGKDPDNRRTFPWDWKSCEIRRDVHAYCRTLIGLRKAHPVLRRGAYRTLQAEGGIHAFARHDEKALCVVVANNADRRQDVTLDLSGFRVKKMTDLLSGETHRVRKDGTLSLVLPPYSGVLLGR